MYGVLVEVNANESNIDRAREFLPQRAAPNGPGVRSQRRLLARRSKWSRRVHRRFETEKEARTAASTLRVGEPPTPDAPAGVTVKTVEVREVLAAI